MVKEVNGAFFANNPRTCTHFTFRFPCFNTFRRWFFLLICVVYSGFVAAMAGLRLEHDSNVYSSKLFGMLLGDFQSDELTDDTDTSTAMKTW